MCHPKECFSMAVCFSPHPVMERETNSILVIVCSYSTPHWDPLVPFKTQHRVRLLLCNSIKARHRDRGGWKGRRLSKEFDGGSSAVFQGAMHQLKVCLLFLHSCSPISLCFGAQILPGKNVIMQFDFITLELVWHLRTNQLISLKNYFINTSNLIKSFLVWCHLWKCIS